MIEIQMKYFHLVVDGMVDFPNGKIKRKANIPNIPA